MSSMTLESEVIARMILWYSLYHDTEETREMIRRASIDDEYKRELITKFLDSRGK